MKLLTQIFCCSNTRLTKMVSEVKQIPGHGKSLGNTGPQGRTRLPGEAAEGLTQSFYVDIGCGPDLFLTLARLGCSESLANDSIYFLFSSSLFFCIPYPYLRQTDTQVS